MNWLSMIPQETQPGPKVWPWVVRLLLMRYKPYLGLTRMGEWADTDIVVLKHLGGCLTDILVTLIGVVQVAQQVWINLVLLIHL